jgi:MobA/MobL family
MQIDKRTHRQKHDWSKHKQDVIEWQILGPNMTPSELAVRAEQSEKRWDAREGRAMDVALPHELNPKAQWDLLRGFGLQLRDEYGAALCVSLHHPNTKGDQRNAHGHIFMTSRVVDDDGDFSKTKIRSLDDRKLGPVEVEPLSSAKPTGWLCVENRALPITEIDLLEIIPGRGLHIRTRQESWLISLPEELQSDELLRAITSGEVNCLSGSCEPFEQLLGSSKASD